MDPNSLIAAAAIFLSLLTFVSMQFGGKREATADYVKHLEARVEKLERALEIKDERILTLEKENIGLLRQLVARSNGA